MSSTSASSHPPATKPLWRIYLVFLVPMVLSNILQGLSGTLNGIYIGQMLGTHALRLEYRFVPGDPADGVTAHLPLALVNALSPSACEWLVPGMLMEKVGELIRGLPKSLRRNFVPAPDFARAFVESLGKDAAIRQRPLAEVLATYLRKVTGIEVTAADFAGIELPAHLLMRLRVHDEKGKTIAEGRDLAVRVGADIEGGGAELDGAG